MTMLTAPTPEYYGVTRVVGPTGGPVAVAHAAFKSSVLFTRPNNATAYTAGDVIGRADTVTPANAGDAIIQLAAVGPVGGAVSLETVELHFDTNAIPAGMTTFRLHLYGLSPAAVLDNAVYNLSSAEIARYLGFITLNAPVDFGDTIYSITTDIRRHINLVPYSGSLFAELETVGAFTPAALTPVTLKVSSRQLSPATQLVEDLPIANSFPALPTLNLKFSESKNLLDDVTGRRLITFTRASTATFIDSAGLLQTAVADVPRFDHDPVTRESLGLLVEEQRTNLIFNSEDTSTWLAPTGITLTQNSIASPSSAITADLYTEDTSTGLHVQEGPAFTFVTSTTYTYSVFVKAVGSRNFEIGFPATQFTARFARFTLSGSGAVQGVDAGVTASVQALGNGWYRCAATSTCAVGAGARVGNFVIDASHARTYTGNGSSGIYIWGAQLEAGAFPTSYIPTTTAAATRSADVASITGTNFSSWYNQAEGTVYGSTGVLPGTAVLWDIGSGGAFGTTAYSSYTGTAWAAGSGSPLNISSSVVASSSSAHAIALRANDTVAAANGGLGVTDTSCSMPAAPTTFTIGKAGWSGAGGYANCPIRRLTYWPQRLTNSTLQASTQ